MNKLLTEKRKFWIAFTVIATGLVAMAVLTIIYIAIPVCQVIFN